MCRISQSLRFAAGGGYVIRHVPGGYVLNIEQETVDLHRFRSLRRRAEALAGSGDSEHASLLFMQADSLWRGPALATLDGDWISGMRITMEEERRAAMLRRIELDLMMGRHTELIPELAQLCEKFPLDEALTQHRMIALFRAGRQTDALQLFRDIRMRLADSGIDPGAGLAELHQLILRHDRQLAITPAHRQSGQGTQPNTLPPDIHDFVGRADELRVLTGSIQHGNSVRVCIIDGMGGVGETALAVRAARQVSGRYPDAQLYLSLNAKYPQGAQLDYGEAVSRLLTMLEIPAEGIPVAVPERAQLWQAALRHRRALIVLDDVSDPGEIRSIIPVRGDCLIIICSRWRRADSQAHDPVSLRPFTSAEAITLMTRIIGPEAKRMPAQLADADDYAAAFRWRSAWLRACSVTGTCRVLASLP